MDGVHDLGGKPGHGQVNQQDNEPVFHDRWEAVVFAMMRSVARAGAYHNTDRFRHAVERINPQAYLEHGYYGRWLGALETLLVEAGVFRQSEITQRAIELGGSENDVVAAQPAAIPDTMKAHATTDENQRDVAESPRFHIGDKVRTQAEPVTGHTRLPAYARNRIGEIVACHGGWVFPDTNAHGLGEQPKHLYTVQFRSEELWQKDGFCVSLDLFEPYLESIKNE